MVFHQLQRHHQRKECLQRQLLLVLHRQTMVFLQRRDHRQGHLRIQVSSQHPERRRRNLGQKERAESKPAPSLFELATLEVPRVRILTKTHVHPLP